MNLFNIPGTLQDACGVWDDFDHEMRQTARRYLATFSFSGFGASADAPTGTPSSWYETRLILGSALTDRIRGKH